MTNETPSTQSNETPSTTQSDLEFLMSGYSSPAKVIDKTVETVSENKPTETAKPVLQNIPSSSRMDGINQTTNTDASAPFGRYQRGKKKGQPRNAPYQGKNQPSPSPQATVIEPKLSGMLIDGGLFLTLINLVLPMGISLVNNMTEKDVRKHMKPEKLQLSQQQLKELEPVCDAVMKQIALTGNPMLLLIIGICAAMGLNFMAYKIEINSKFIK